jgi:hypothetical protein
LHVVGDEGVEIPEGSQDIRVEAGECPERAYFVPDKGNVHGPAWLLKEPRYAVM